MILVVLLIGVVLIVSALRNTQGALFSALATDVPQYITWAAAIIALGVIGWIPGLKPISRGLLALVLLVIILRNYQGIITGVKAVASAPQTNGTQGSNASNPLTGSNTVFTPLTIYGPSNTSATGN